jgi:1,4-alpha-glucan branching enzyme
MQTMNQPGISARNATPRRTVSPVKLPDVQKHSANGDAEKSTAKKTIEVEFKLDAPRAQSVVVAGSFNDWGTKKTLLVRNNGAWTARLKLPQGRHEYRFIVDGEWVSDPAAKESVANPFGGTNSVVSV